MKAAFSDNVSINGVNNSASINEGECDGVTWSIDFTNDVEFEIEKVYTANLYHWDGPTIASGCIGTVPTSTSISTNIIAPSTPTPTKASSSITTTTSSSSSATQTSSSSSSSSSTASLTAAPVAATTTTSTKMDASAGATMTSMGFAKRYYKALGK